MNFIIQILVFLTLVWYSVQLDDPVAFTAIKGSLNGNYIAFQATIVNNNADFTSSYGAFKTTRAGVYFFTFTAISPEGSDLRISLRSNGIPVVTIYSGGSKSYNSASGSGLLSLEEGDLVYLYVEKGELYESNRVNRAYTTFSGFQIAEAKSKGILNGIFGRTSLPPHPLAGLHKDENDNLDVLLMRNVTLV